MQNRTKSTIVEREGNLFVYATSGCMAHCVSKCFAMSRGIAVEFKRRWGRVDELHAQKPEIGGIAVLSDSNRFIYYLVTKERYFNKPTYESLKSSLEAMRKHALQHKQTNINIPRIGCGLDRLKWTHVRQILQDVFATTNITITVYVK